MRQKKMILGRFDYACFLTFFAYACCSVAVPVVLVELAGDLHFPLTEGGQGAGGALQIGRSSAMLVTMLLGGFIAGRWGIRRSMSLALCVMGTGILISVLAPSYGVLFWALCLAGLGEGIIEALGTPAVQALHEHDEPSRYVTFTHGFWSVGVVSAMLAAGFALSCGVSWRTILVSCFLLALIPAVLFGFPGERVFPENDSRGHREVWSATRQILRSPRFWISFGAMFLAGGGEYCLTFWAAAFIRLEYAGSAFAGGLGTAIFAAGMILSRLGSGLFVSEKRLPYLILGCAVLGVVFGVLPVFLEAVWILFAVLFVLGIASGPFWPCIQSHCVARLQLDSTIIFILLSCAGVPGCGFFTWLMGALGDRIALRYSFLLIPGCYLFTGVCVAWELLAFRRKKDAEKAEA